MFAKCKKLAGILNSDYLLRKGHYNSVREREQNTTSIYYGTPFQERVSTSPIKD
jgi:hypothetical protein